MTDILPLWTTRIFDVPLAIAQDKLDVILDSVVLPKIRTGELMVVSPKAEFGDFSPGQERPPYQVSGGIAIIPVRGTLVHRGGGMEAMSGLTSYTSLARLLGHALGNNGVKAIMLDMDSPGGEVAGMFEMADKIRSASGRKPVWAYANEMSASAAYLLASASNRIMLGQTASVGSIGIIGTHIDQSGLDAQRGLKYTYIYAGKQKKDGNAHEPLPDDVRQKFQAEIDDVYTMFVDAVARFRNISAGVVRGTEAGMFMGDKAVQARLADRVGTFDDALAMLQSSLVAAPRNKAGQARKENRMNDNETGTGYISAELITTQPDPEIAALKAALAEEKSARLAMEAKHRHEKAELRAQAKIEGAVKSGKLHAVEQALAAVVTAAIYDLSAADASLVVTTAEGSKISLAAALDAWIDIRPSRTAQLDDEVVPDEIVPLGNTGERNDDNSLFAQIDKYLGSTQQPNSKKGGAN